MLATVGVGQSQPVWMSWLWAEKTGITMDWHDGGARLRAGPEFHSGLQLESGLLVEPDRREIGPIDVYRDDRVVGVGGKEFRD